MCSLYKSVLRSQSRPCYKLLPHYPFSPYVKFPHSFLRHHVFTPTRVYHETTNFVIDCAGWLKNVGVLLEQNRLVRPPVIGVCPPPHVPRHQCWNHRPKALQGRTTCDEIMVSCFYICWDYCICSSTTARRSQPLTSSRGTLFRGSIL